MRLWALIQLSAVVSIATGLTIGLEETSTHGTHVQSQRYDPYKSNALPKRGKKGDLRRFVGNVPPGSPIQLKPALKNPDPNQDQSFDLSTKSIPDHRKPGNIAGGKDGSAFDDFFGFDPKYHSMRIDSGNVGPVEFPSQRDNYTHATLDRRYTLGQTGDGGNLLWPYLSYTPDMEKALDAAEQNLEESQIADAENQADESGDMADDTVEHKQMIMKTKFEWATPVAERKDPGCDSNWDCPYFVRSDKIGVTKSWEELLLLKGMTCEVLDLWDTSDTTGRYGPLVQDTAQCLLSGFKRHFVLKAFWGEVKGEFDKEMWCVFVRTWQQVRSPRCASLGAVRASPRDTWSWKEGASSGYDRAVDIFHKAKLAAECQAEQDANNHAFQIFLKAYLDGRSVGLQGLEEQNRVMAEDKAEKDAAEDIAAAQAEDDAGKGAEQKRAQDESPQEAAKAIASMDPEISADDEGGMLNGRQEEEEESDGEEDVSARKIAKKKRQEKKKAEKERQTQEDQAYSAGVDDGQGSAHDNTLSNAE